MSASSTPPTPALPSTGSRRDPVALALLALALLVGSLVFVRLGQWSLWIDEAFTLHDSLWAEGQRNPLGYRVLGAFYRILGVEDGHRPDELGLRLLPAILGWAGVPLTFWAFRRAAGDRAAAAAALLVAASSWHLYWSQNARFYTLVQDLVLLGSGLGLRSMWGRSWSLLVLALGAFAMAALTHPTAALAGGAFLAGLLLVGLTSTRPPGFVGGRAKLLIGLVAVGVLVGLWWGPPILRSWRLAKGGGTPVHLLLTTGFFVTPILGAAALLGGWLALARRDTFGRLALTVVVLGMVQALAISLYARFTAQYMFAFLPWFAILATWHLRPAATEPRSGPLALGLVGILTVSGLADEMLYLTSRRGERPAWREAYRYVWNERRADDQVFGMAAPVAEYYLEPAKTDVSDVTAISYLDAFRSRVPEKWARTGRRAWFVLNPEELMDWKAEDRTAFREMLAQDCRLVRSWPLYIESRDMSVEVYLRE